MMIRLCTRIHTGRSSGSGPGHVRSIHKFEAPWPVGGRRDEDEEDEETDIGLVRRCQRGSACLPELSLGWSVVSQKSISTSLCRFNNNIAPTPRWPTSASGFIIINYLTQYLANNNDEPAAPTSTYPNFPPRPFPQRRLWIRPSCMHDSFLCDTNQPLGLSRKIIICDANVLISDHSSGLSSTQVP